MKPELDQQLKQVTSERAKLASLERQVVKQKDRVEQAERELLKALSAQHSNKPEPVAVAA